MMKNYFFKVLLMVISMTTVTVMNSMAAEQTKVTNEQSHPRSPKLRTTSVKLKKTTMSQKNKIVSLVVANKGIKSAYFKGSTIYVSYNPKWMNSANAQMAAKNAYNKVVGKHGHNYNAQPQPGRYGSTAPAPNNTPKPQSQPNNPPKPQPDNHSNPQPNNHGNPQQGNHQQGNHNNNYNPQPQPGRK